MHTGEQEPSSPGHRSCGAAHHTSNSSRQRTQPTPPCRKETPCQTTKTNHPHKANPAGTKRVGKQGGLTKRDRGARGRRGERSPSPPPTYTQLTQRRAPGHGWAPTGPAMEPYGPTRERVCPRACTTAHQGKERMPDAGHAGHTRSTACQHAPRHKAGHHHDKHPRPTTSKPPRTSPSPAVPTAQQLPSRWTCVRPAVNPAPAGYETVAVRTDVCAPGSESSPCRLRNSCRLDGRVCTRQ